MTIFLRGGADGLSLLRPLDGRLDDLRGDLAVPAGSTLPAADGFGFHPALARTAARFAAGEVAVVPAVGVPDAGRSHFGAQFLVERGTAERAAVGGWLGRALAASAGGAPADQQGDGIAAVSLGRPAVPVSLSGSASVVAAATAAQVGLRAGPAGTTVSADELAALWADDDGPLAGAVPVALGALERFAPLAEPEGPDDGEPAGGPPDAAAELVRMVAAGVRPRVAALDLGGWDHHADQGTVDGDLAGLAAGLDAAVDTVLAGVPGAVVFVVSEFGRRVAPNDSAGTDHGTGGLALVAGAGVRGGVHGDWPGLEALVDGDLRPTVDTRVVQAELVERLLDVDGAAVLPGVPATRLGLLS